MSRCAISSNSRGCSALSRRRSGYENGADESAVDREESGREARARDRAQRLDRQRQAVAFNDELGAAVVKTLSRVKIDGRTVRILAAVDVHGDLTKIAMRGARYGFPGWVAHTQSKTGKPKIE
jgi:hypothetical protein